MSLTLFSHMFSFPLSHCRKSLPSCCRVCFSPSWVSPLGTTFARWPLGWFTLRTVRSHFWFSFFLPSSDFFSILSRHPKFSNLSWYVWLLSIGDGGDDPLLSRSPHHPWPPRSRGRRTESRVRTEPSIIRRLWIGAIHEAFTHSKVKSFSLF